MPASAPESDDVHCAIRQLFSDSQPRDRDTALRDLARALGYGRLGPRIRDALATDLRAAVRRGILQNERGMMTLLCRSIEGYERDFLKTQFLAALGRTWTPRNAAVAAFARWLGFARTGPTIVATAHSLINGLLRERRIESDGPSLRRK